MKKTATAEIKTYRGNSDIFFNVDGEYIGSIIINHSPDSICEDETREWNMEQFREDVVTKFNALTDSLEDEIELDEQSLKEVLSTIEARISHYF